MYSKKYFPKKFVEKGNKLFGIGPCKDEWGDMIDVWEIDASYEDVTLFYKGIDVASIDIAELPGCCGVVVLTNLNVSGGNKKGYGEFLSEAALFVAANKGYTLAIATTVFKNKPSNLIAESLKATQVASFSNRKTKNVVKVWTKHLPAKSKNYVEYD